MLSVSMPGEEVIRLYVKAWPCMILLVMTYFLFFEF